MDKIKRIARISFKRFQSVIGCDSELLERNMLLQKKMLSDQRLESRIKDLQNAEFRVFSQWGEDGILDWIFSRIPDINKSFVEFGVQNYRESNTRCLLMAEKWRGLVIDGAINNIENIRFGDTTCMLSALS